MASRKTECANPGSVCRFSLAHVVADIPDCAIIHGIDCGLGVVFPTHGILDSLTFDKSRFARCQFPRRVIAEPAGETLACEGRRPTERVPDADIAEFVDCGTGHPPIETVRGISTLLFQ